MKMVEKICEFCGKVFMIDPNNKNDVRRKYCSWDCYEEMDNQRDRERMKRRRAGEKNEYERICLHCGREFKTTRGQTRYCNEECRENARVERVKSYGAEYREKKKLQKYEDELKKKEQLHKANAIALENGMSYGQYYAMLYAQQHTHDAKKRR